jgi:mitogen-activated protein kinase 15
VFADGLCLQAYGPSWNATSNTTDRKVVLEKIFDAFQNATDTSRTCRYVLFVKQLTALQSDSSRILRLLDLIPSNEGKDVFLVWEHSEIDLHAVIRANILEPIHIAYTGWQLFQVRLSILRSLLRPLIDSLRARTRL